MEFTPASLHQTCTKALLHVLDWRGDGFYFEGRVPMGDYRISTYPDTCHKRKGELTPHEILRGGESLVSIQIPTARKDVLVAHPRNLMTTGNFAQRSFMVSLVAICGKAPDPNTPVVFSPEEERLMNPKRDPWLQAIFEDLHKQIG